MSAPARLVVGVDGAVASGKSTLAGALTARLGATLVPEYVAHPAELPGALPPRDARSRWEMQRHYVSAEAARVRSMRPAGRAVLDRTVLSQAAHVDAVYRTDRLDLREPLADWLASRQLVEPEVLVILLDPCGVSQQRFAARESGPARRGTAELFVDPAYVAACEDFLRRVAERLPHLVLAFAPCPDPERVADRILSRPARSPARGLVTTLIEELRAG